MPVVERERYVEIAEVTKVYRSGTAEAVEAVSSVRFSVPRGQFVAVLGPSGCGKSTLLMMVGGLESVTAGRIAVGGAPMTGPRTSIGIMFQDSTLLPWKSAFDNVLFPVRVLKRPLDAYRDGARQLLERVGLDGFMHKKPHELSGGMVRPGCLCGNDRSRHALPDGARSQTARSRGDLHQPLRGQGQAGHARLDRRPRPCLRIRQVSELTDAFP
jgi:ABC-type transporter Mla maintaining outer membrane lipid asymmetry ATPase subunit MlaF